MGCAFFGLVPAFVVNLGVGGPTVPEPSDIGAGIQEQGSCRQARHYAPRAGLDAETLQLRSHERTDLFAEEISP
jgi:hypothetical protein